MLIVNKPAGISTHPNEEGQTGTLANLIAYHFQVNGETIKVRHVHRLDQDTSGAVVFAKHRLAHAILDQQLEKKTLKRTYLAIVEGKLKPKKAKLIRRLEETDHTRQDGGFHQADKPPSPITVPLLSMREKSSRLLN